MKLGWLEKQYVNHSRTHKPMVGAEVNWGHDLANGLVACYLLNEAQFPMGIGVNQRVQTAYVENLADKMTQGRVHEADHAYDLMGECWGFTTTNYDSGISFSVKGGPLLVAPEAMHPTKGITIEFWQKYYGGGIHNQILLYSGDIGLDDNHGYVIWAPNGYDLPFYWSLATDLEGQKSVTYTIPTPPDLNCPPWYHIVCTYDRVKMKVYMNAIVQNEIGQTGNIIYEEPGVWLGNAAPIVAQHSDSRILLFRMWDRGITADEVQWLYEEPYSMVYYPTMITHPKQLPPLESFFLMLQPSNC